MAGEPTARPVPSEIPILVADDISCRKCSYNLRGLFGDGRCPECGTPVGISLRGDLLCYSDPEWVKKLAQGIRYIFLGILATVVVGVLGGVVAINNRGLGNMVALIAGVVGYYGVWLLTEPDPSGVGEDPTVSARRFIRLTLLLVIVGDIGFALLQLIVLPDWIQFSVIAVPIVTGLIGVAGEFAKFTYLRALAQRIPDDRLARRANLLRWAFVMAWAGVFLIYAVAPMGIGPLGSAVGPMAGAAPAAPGAPINVGMAMIVGCVGIVIVIAFSVFGIMTLLFLRTMGRRFREQSKAARNNWEDVMEQRPLDDPASSS